MPWIRVGDLATLCAKATKVSADFEIARDGTIYKLNPQLSQWWTWQAGVSEWNGKRNINNISFGIEQEHIPGQDWPAAQVKATAKVCAFLCDKFEIPREHIASHADVARPVGRKNDPEHFPWADFREYLDAELDA